MDGEIIRITSTKLLTFLLHPNRKVAHVLDALNLTYETKFLDFDKNEQKAPEHTKLNPNGRIPTLIDHANNDFVLWSVNDRNTIIQPLIEYFYTRESDAILLYLVDKYDTDNRLTSSVPEERYQIIQWLFFQSSGQGYCCPIHFLFCNVNTYFTPTARTTDSTIGSP